MAKELLNALLNARLITKSQINAVEEKRNETGDSDIAVLIKSGHISEQRLMSFFAKDYNFKAIDLTEQNPDPVVLELIKPEIANKYRIFPVQRKGKSLVLGMVNPLDEEAFAEVSFLTGLNPERCYVRDSQMQKYLEKYYPLHGGGLVAMESQATTEKDRGDLQVEEEYEEEVSFGTSSQAADFVKYIIDDAVARKASDIHIEFIGKRQRVRMRIDGVLQEVVDAPGKFSLAIIQRVKILSKMDISEHFKPQDGRIQWRFRGRDIDLRVSVIPTVIGEKIVMRILDKSSLMVDLKDLGFSEKSRKYFEDSLERPYGIILITGPTGSGKSTTLYSALSRLNRPNIQILTVEDPVEYNLRGINQVPINADIGFDFPSALRSILRHAPDIVMVGEIRDTETGEIAIRAALAGQLVLSTIHTNDAPSTVNRLVDMGVKPFLVAASLNLIQAQRLVRKICSNCKAPFVYPEKFLVEVGLSEEEIKNSVFYKGRGCGTCNNTGYKGRVAITEVMPISKKLRQMVVDNESSTALKRAAEEEGMVSMRNDALDKVKKGLTTLEEMIRETSSL
ncbi:Flp pilus assembly complex ATPase component TadA [candidate division WOR-3 bacterium]|nr:Flp pilus assembly complex ATPase component TadA [candidate division WOR-3 bacterium]